MTRKENLIFEMENLTRMLKEYLKVLEEGEINEMAYQRLEEEMFSVTWALRHYFDIETSEQITILIPDK